MDIVHYTMANDWQDSSITLEQLALAQLYICNHQEPAPEERNLHSPINRD
jgi:hypothetical protein